MNTASLSRARAASRARRAVTLIEAVLFISIALGLIVAGLRFYDQANRAARITANIRLISSLVTEMRDANMRTGTVARWVDTRDADGNPLWPADPAWQTIGAYLIKSAAVPPTNIFDDTTIEDSSGRVMPVYVGTVDIDPTSVSMGPGYIIGIDGEITVAECTRMAAVNEQGAGALGFGILQVYLYSEAGGVDMDFMAVPPFTPGQAATHCSRIFGRDGVGNGLLIFTYSP